MAETPSYKGAVVQSDKEQRTRALTSRLETSRVEVRVEKAVEKAVDDNSGSDILLV